MDPLKYTNYLGELTGGSAPTLENIGQWEAVITFCTYISRLNYDLKPRKIIECYKYLNFSPIIFNTISGLLTKMNLASIIPLERLIKPDTPMYGSFIYDKKDDLPLSITVFDYSNGSSRIFPNEKIIVIGFRGTLSFKTVFKDLNMISKPLSTVFKDLPSVKSGEGKAHGGFINGIANVFGDIVSLLDKLLESHSDVSRIIVTGHSLGAGYAHICGLGLANMKRNGKPYPKINIISFGGPKTFSESGRDIFNVLLTEGYLTLDRIVNAPYNPDPLIVTTNIIPAIPIHFYHPGFSLTTGEKYSLKRTNRSRHVENTRRKAGLTRKQAWYSTSKLFKRNYNPLPYYPEFFKNFKDSLVEPSFTNEHYKSLINTSLNGTVYTGTTESARLAQSIIQKLLGLSPEELQNIGIAAEQDQEDAAKDVIEKEKNSISELPEIGEVASGEAAAEAAQDLVNNPRGGAWFSSNKKNNTNIIKYKNQNKNYYPNEIVYSCSGITTPAPPPVQCHLGYMGVGWLGVGSAIIPGRSREYNRYAVIYNINGRWLYVSDNDPMYSSKTRKNRKN